MSEKLKTEKYTRRYYKIQEQPCCLFSNQRKVRLSAEASCSLWRCRGTWRNVEHLTHLPLTHDWSSKEELFSLGWCALFIFVFMVSTKQQCRSPKVHNLLMYNIATLLRSFVVTLLVWMTSPLRWHHCCPSLLDNSCCFKSSMAPLCQFDGITLSVWWHHAAVISSISSLLILILCKLIISNIRQFF